MTDTQVTEAEQHAYLAKSGMFQTHPACPTFKTLDKAQQEDGTSKVGATRMTLAEAREQIEAGGKECGMCVKIAAQIAEKERVMIPGLPGVSVEVKDKDDAPKAPARKTAAKRTKLTPAAETKPVEAEAKPIETKPATEAPAKPKTRKIEGKANGTNAISLFEVFGKADDEGQLPTGAYGAYRLKVKAVLVATGGDLEKTDLTKIDVEATLAEFDKNSATLLDSTRRSYKDAFKRAVRLFQAYVADPKNWNPTAPAERSVRAAVEGKQPTKAQVRKWALEQGHIKEGELGPNYVPVKLYNLYNEAHAEAK